MVKYGKLIKAIIRTETINTQKQKKNHFFKQVIQSDLASMHEMVLTFQ